VSTGDPTQQIFWLASRALGIVAIALLAISVALGLAMSGRLARRPGLPAKLKRFHEAATLVTLGLIVTHAGALLADPYLRPGLDGIALPFHLAYRPLWTATGILAGWLAVILGLSFYVRRWIGIKTWRWLHRWTLAIYLLAVAHAIGAGTDGHATWMLTMLTLLTSPIVFALTYRMLPPSPRTPRRRDQRAPDSTVTSPIATHARPRAPSRAHARVGDRNARPVLETSGSRKTDVGRRTRRLSTGDPAGARSTT
jgi:hypothetical protein